MIEAKDVCLTLFYLSWWWMLITRQFFEAEVIVLIWSEDKSSDGYFRLLNLQ